MYILNVDRDRIYIVIPYHVAVSTTDVTEFYQFHRPGPTLLISDVTETDHLPGWARSMSKCQPRCFQTSAHVTAVTRTRTYSLYIRLCCISFLSVSTLQRELVAVPPVEPVAVLLGKLVAVPLGNPVAVPPGKLVAVPLV